MLIPRTSSSALISLEAAVERLTAAVTPVAPLRLAPGAALGATMARDAVAPASRPERPVAIRDGWAVSLAAVAGASRQAPVLLAAPPPWCEAGEPLPEGSDTILSPDAVEPATPNEVMADAPFGDGAAMPAFDLRLGETVAAAGRPVTAGLILALAAAGIDAIAVRAPRLRLVTLEGGDHSDALAPTLTALIQAAGARVVDTIRAPREVDALAAAIADAAEVDAVIVVGGTGFGRRDGSAAALALGGTLEAHGIALRPGDTAGFGQAGGRPVLLLPGRPDAALAAFLALGLPLLRALAGTELPRLATAPLLRKIASVIGWSEIVFVERRPGGLLPLGGAGLPLRSLARAEGAVLVPPGREGYPDGATVEMIPL